MTYKVAFVDVKGQPLSGTFYFKSSTGGVRGFIAVSGTDTEFDDSFIPSEVSYYEAVVPGFEPMQSSALTDSMLFTFQEPITNIQLSLIGAILAFGAWSIFKGVRV